MVRQDDPATQTAMAQARATLPGFLAALENPPPGARDFAVKYPLGGWEHIWVTGISRHDEMIHGVLANDPLQDGYARGKSVRIPIAAISDWAWRDASGRLHGNHTRPISHE